MKVQKSKVQNRKSESHAGNQYTCPAWALATFCCICCMMPLFHVGIYCMLPYCMLAQTHLPHANVQLRTLHTVYEVYAGGSVGLPERGGPPFEPSPRAKSSSARTVRSPSCILGGRRISDEPRKSAMTTRMAGARDCAGAGHTTRFHT